MVVNQKKGARNIKWNKMPKLRFSVSQNVSPQGEFSDEEKHISSLKRTVVLEFVSMGYTALSSEATYSTPIVYSLSYI